MINEDAVKTLKSWIECIATTNCDYDCEHCHLQIDLNAVSEACAVAITELSQIDDDTVSRKAVLDAIMGEPTDAHYPSWYAERIKQLPPSPTPSRPQKPQIPFVTLQRACKYRCLSMDRYGGDTELHPTCHHTIYASWDECAENTCPLLKPYKGGERMRLDDPLIQELQMVRTNIPIRSMRLIQKKIAKYEMDKMTDGDINRDFIKGFQCAVTMIVSELKKGTPQNL